MCLIREDQPYAEGGPLRRGTGTLDCAAEHREVYHLPFRDRFRIGKHHGVQHGEGDSIVVAKIETCGFHGGQRSRSRVTE